jgi:hypothetical protein
MSFVCRKVLLSVSGWSLVQRIPTECGVSECDREASIMKTSLLTRGSCAEKKWKINMDWRPSTLRDVLLGSVAKRRWRVQHPKFEAWNWHKFIFWRREYCIPPNTGLNCQAGTYITFSWFVAHWHSDSSGPCSNVSGDTQLCLHYYFQGRFSLSLSFITDRNPYVSTNESQFEGFVSLIWYTISI